MHLLCISCVSPLIQAVTKLAPAAEEKRDLSQESCLLLMGHRTAAPVLRSSRSPLVPAAERRQIRQQIDNDAAIAAALSDLEKAAVVAEASSKIRWPQGWGVHTRTFAMNPAALLLTRSSARRRNVGRGRSESARRRR